jgi:folate-binding protein YgfZ
MPVGATYLHSYHPAAVIKIAGEDAFTFLQGQFTNELRQGAGNIVYGLWLNQKGKVLADSHVLRLSGREFVLVSTSSTAAIISQRLEEYIVADDVALVNETEKFRGLAIWGEGGAERVKDLFGAVPGRGLFLAKDEWLVFAGRRVNGVNYEIIGPENMTTQLRETLLQRDCVGAGDNEAEVARLMHGIPAIPQDIGPGDLPNEGNLEDSTLSYTKGCYLGQEVMARLKNLGQVRRYLRVVRGTGPVPAAGTPLCQAGKKAGEIRSVASTPDGYLAMAMLTRLGFNENAGYGFTATGPVTVKTIAHG